MQARLDQNNLMSYVPANGPAFNFSELVHLDRSFAIRGFAIKYVLEGLERYWLNGVPHPVRAGQYLLANQWCQGSVLIDSAVPVKGLCIELTAELINEVASGHRHPELFDGASGCFFTDEEFPEAIHRAQSTSLGPVLWRAATGLFAGSYQVSDAGHEWYYHLAERVVQDHLAVVPRLRAVQAVRTATRKDIYQRVQRARMLMDDHLGGPITVAAMAREAAMSEYHFFRAFRMVEGVGPHRYHRMRRLELARTALLGGNCSVQEAALLTGFADASAFSKAFRKQYGHAPSELLTDRAGMDMRQRRK